MGVDSDSARHTNGQNEKFVELGARHLHDNTTYFYLNSTSTMPYFETFAVHDVRDTVSLVQQCIRVVRLRNIETRIV